jgi:hypothetical protein
MLTFTASLAGTVCAVVGVQLGGYALTAGTVIWILFGLAIGGLSMILLASIATAEIQEDARTGKARDRGTGWRVRPTIHVRPRGPRSP